MTHEKRFLMIGLIASTIIAGCARQADGSEFLGRWDPVKRNGASFTMDIGKTGDTFFMTDGGNTRYPAVYNKEHNTLDVTITGMKIEFSYFKDRDTISGLDSEWKRIK